METTTPNTTPRDSSWGALISIFLILGIIVAGAYYAFTDRITPAPVENTEVSY